MASSLDRLPETFRFSDALEVMNERRLRSLLHSGRIERVSRGLYRKAGTAGDDELIEVATRAPRATLALRSALARQDLVDDIPAYHDIAIPRGMWAPELDTPIRWHRFAPETFDIGRDMLPLGAVSIGIFSPERSIVDAFRLRGQEGDDMANDALKRWLHRGGQPSELLRVARHFPASHRSLHTAMSILL